MELMCLMVHMQWTYNTGGDKKYTYIGSSIY